MSFSTEIRKEEENAVENDGTEGHKKKKKKMRMKMKKKASSKFFRLLQFLRFFAFD